MALRNLEFVSEVPASAIHKGSSPLQRAKTKLIEDIDLQIRLIENPDHMVTKTVKKRDGTTHSQKRKPRSWVSYSDSMAYITVRVSNRVINLGGDRGSVIRCESDKVVETLGILREWAKSPESDLIVDDARQKSKRGPRRKR